MERRPCNPLHAGAYSRRACSVRCGAQLVHGASGSAAGLRQRRMRATRMHEPPWAASCTTQYFHLVLA